MSSSSGCVKLRSGEGKGGLRRASQRYEQLPRWESSRRPLGWGLRAIAFAERACNGKSAWAHLVDGEQAMKKSNKVKSKKEVPGAPENLKNKDYLQDL